MKDLFDISLEELTPTILTLKRIHVNMDLASEHLDGTADSVHKTAVEILLPLLESMESVLKRYKGSKVRLCLNICYNCRIELKHEQILEPLIGIVGGCPIPLCPKCYPDFQTLPEGD